MIGVLTHHWVREDRFEDARIMLLRNGAAQRLAPGFVNRYMLLSREDSSQITSLVVWGNDDFYDSWRVSPERSAAMTGSEDLWLRMPESERFDVD